MAATVVEAGADRDGAVDLAAVGRAAGRQREVAGSASMIAHGCAQRSALARRPVGANARIVLVVLPRFRLPSKRIPSKLVSMMKLTTPATASAPYTDDAPPVRTSARWISDAGMTLRSADWFVLFGSPGIEAAAIDENQRALRTEVAKVDFGRTRRAVRDARRLRGADGRQLVENVFDPGRAGQLHVLVGNDRDRSSGPRGSAAECASR